MTKATVKTLRLRNSKSNDIPKFPKLKPKDYDPYLVKWMQKASVTLKEAAYLVHEVNPDNPPVEITEGGADEPSQTYYWLDKERKLHHRISFLDVNERCTLGDVIRFLWETPRRNFSLKVWNVYFQVTNGEFSGALSKRVSDLRYKEAADIIWKSYGDYSKEEVIETLLKLHKLVRDDNGMPMFLTTTKDSLSQLLKGQAVKKAGRPKKSGEPCIPVGEEQIIEKIKDLIKK